MGDDKEDDLVPCPPPRRKSMRKKDKSQNIGSTLNKSVRSASIIQSDVDLLCDENLNQNNLRLLRSSPPLLITTNSIQSSKNDNMNEAKSNSVTSDITSIVVKEHADICYESLDQPSVGQQLPRPPPPVIITTIDRQKHSINEIKKDSINSNASIVRPTKPPPPIIKTSLEYEKSQKPQKPTPPKRILKNNIDETNQVISNAPKPKPLPRPHRPNPAPRHKNLGESITRINEMDKAKKNECHSSSLNGSYLPDFQSNALSKVPNITDPDQININIRPTAGTDLLKEVENKNGKMCGSISTQYNTAIQESSLAADNVHKENHNVKGANDLTTGKENTKLDTVLEANTLAFTKLQEFKDSSDRLVSKDCQERQLTKSVSVEDLVIINTTQKVKLCRSKSLDLTLDESNAKEIIFTNEQFTNNNTMQSSFNKPKSHMKVKQKQLNIRTQSYENVVLQSQIQNRESDENIYANENFHAHQNVSRFGKDFSEGTTSSAKQGKDINNSNNVMEPQVRMSMQPTYYGSDKVDCNIKVSQDASSITEASVLPHTKSICTEKNPEVSSSSTKQSSRNTGYYNVIVPKTPVLQKRVPSSSPKIMSSKLSSHSNTLSKIIITSSNSNQNTIEDDIYLSPRSDPPKLPCTPENVDNFNDSIYSVPKCEPTDKDDLDTERNSLTLKGNELYDSPSKKTSQETYVDMAGEKNHSPSTCTEIKMEDKKTVKAAKKSGYEDVDLNLQVRTPERLPPRPPPPRRTTVKKNSVLDSALGAKEHVVNDENKNADEIVNNEYSSIDSLLHDSERPGWSSGSESEEENSVATKEQSMAKPQNKLHLIAKEILTTERSFVEALSLICEGFLVALDLAIVKNPKLLPENGYAIMFMNIQQIYKLDQRFLHDLEQRMENWERNQRLGDIVQQYGHYLRMYTTYIKGYDEAMAMYLESLVTNMKFAQIVNQFESDTRAKNLKLTSFLLKPIQRIPSYRLLLFDYLENTPEGTQEHEDISDAVTLVSEIANDINESMKEGEKFQELLRIQSLITNTSDIVQPGRFLLKEGVLQKQSRKELQQRTFILFTDALLYCSSFGHNQLKLILELPLAGMLVQQPDSYDLTTEFSVITTKRSFLLNASTTHERDNWVACLQEAIEVVNKKIGTFALQKDNDHATQLYSDVGGVAPPWIPDGRVTMCQICTCVFTVYNRRHHCRACGKVVCSDCSANEAPLRYMNYEAARVCGTCYNQLFTKFHEVSQGGKCDQDHMENLHGKFKDFKKRRKTKRLLPSTLTEVSAQDEGIETSGFLRMRKGKKEKKCWFVLKDHVLYMYKASSDPAALSTYPILGYKVDVGGNWDREEFVFELTHPGVKEALIFRAENRTAAERWLYCLCKAISLSKR